MTRCQRWRERRGSYRPAGEPIRTSRFGVEVIDRATAKRFVIEHHYSGSFPAALVCVGLFEARAWVTPELVGVAVFSQPMSQAAIPKWANVPTSEGVELGRFVLLDHVPANGETWMLSRSLAALKRQRPQARAVLSYSDPCQRVAVDGTVVCPGHVGTIYQAANARHVGRSKRRRLILGPDGRVLSERTLQKVRRDERNAGNAYRAMVRLGAPQRRVGESGDAYVRRALADGPFRRQPHPGNLAYVFTVGDKRERRHTASGLPPALPYPKAENSLVRQKDELGRAA